MKHYLALIGVAVLCSMRATAADASQRFQATLTGAQQVPPVVTSATATGTVLLNDAEDQITVNLTFANLTSNANAAHIHGPAASGSNAGILFPFSGVPTATSGSIPPQTFAISAPQVTQLKAGQFYFNIHSDNFPGGEIRGQILIAPSKKFVGTLTGSQQAPPTSSTATGSGTVLLTATENSITAGMSFSNLTSNANMAHIHGPAAPGANAPILFPFSSVPASTSGSIPEQTFSINSTQVTDLKAAQHYFNIHSDTFPGGEIRGQILDAPTQLFSATLSGRQETPFNVSGATGTGTVLLSAAEDQITVNLSFSGLSGNATAAHIHGPAPVGTPAGILFPLSGVPSATSGTIPQQTFSITPTHVTELKTGQLYFNVHSGSFPDGETRGQILIAPVQKFVATLNGAHEVPPNGSTATGAGSLFLNPPEDQITVNGSFSGLSSAASAAHVHGPAPEGVNAPILFPLDGVIAVTSETIPDQTFAITAAQVAQLKSGQFYMNVHSGSFSGGEIRGQFAAIPALTVAKAGTSNGTVTSSPAGIVCGADCREAYDSGTMVTLTAGAPPSGAFFAGWSGGGCSGAGSCVVALNADTTVTAAYSTTAFTFTDDPLSAGVTIKAVHITQLRDAINTLRANNQLPAFVFTDPVLTVGSTPIKAVHVTELRSALDAVYAARGRALPMYTNPSLTAGQTVLAVHISELRLAARNVE